ncbi:hypothetical protein HZC09_05945 [Candidatus Micrarchaeota archaeon]|nr:hypothetical protein [Candidatus Micrarchaeota archaeon]
MFSLRLVATQLLGSFALAQVLGLAVGGLFASRELGIVENPSDPSNALYFFGGILLVTVLMLLVLKYYKGKLLFIAMETVLIFVTSDLFLSLFLPGIYAAGIAFALVALRHVYPKARQALILSASVIVGALLGSSLDFLPVLLFVVLLSSYDFVAVFMTKHMITLAKALDNQKNNFTVAFRHKKDVVELGTGDFVVPIVLCVSASQAFGIAPALFAALGATAGLASLLFFMEKKKGYYPGLPPVVFGALLALGLFLGAKAVLGA